MSQFLPPFKIEKVTCGSVMQFTETLIVRNKDKSIGKILHCYKHDSNGVVSPYTEKEITDYISKDIFKIIE